MQRSLLSASSGLLISFSKADKFESSYNFGSRLFILILSNGMKDSSFVYNRFLFDRFSATRIKLLNGSDLIKGGHRLSYES